MQQHKSSPDIFISGFFGNAILSILLTYLGEKLNDSYEDNTNKTEMEKALGEGKCHVLSVRAEGGVLVEEGEF